MKKISLIIPVYNRPTEVEELLESLAAQTFRDFEVVIVEDGSSQTSREVVERYSERLDVSYYYQENGGPASARNTGAAKAKGDFLVIMDSDCLVPADYFATVQRHIDGYKGRAAGHDNRDARATSHNNLGIEAPHATDKNIRTLTPGNRGDKAAAHDSEDFKSTVLDAGGNEITCGTGVGFYGGADSAAPDFSPLQKAVSYSMTSPFTTGGIRGKAKGLSGNGIRDHTATTNSISDNKIQNTPKKSEKFTPRSFNLGIDKALFQSVGGFDAGMRIGEDIDFSYRVAAAGVGPVFLPDATVCHKRRTSMRLFFKQVFVFGTARINLNLRHPRSRRVVFYLPALFTVGSAALIVFAAALAFTPCRIHALWALALFGLLMLLWFTDSAVRNRSLRIGWLSIWTSFIQLYGYGLGFMYGIWMRRIRRLPEKETYRVTRFFSQKTR